jgi:hypothetical protein
MKTVLYIGPGGLEYWRKCKGHWQLQTGATHGAVWAVTDLAEESLVEIQMPRLFGRDRANFLTRQLATRFPDTAYRVALPLRAGGSLMDLLAPARALLVAADASERIQTALDTQTTPVAGVWSSSQLLALLGQNKRLPSELFVLLPGQRSSRIVFLKNRQPVLARLAPASAQPAQQAAEIVRTLRHLENIRGVERAQRRYSVLVLGPTIGLGAALAAQGLDLVAPLAAWEHASPQDWRFVLFDLVLDSPCGQLAPMAARKAFLGQRLRNTLYGTSAVSLAATLWFANSQFQSTAAAQQERDRTQLQIEEVKRELAQTERDISRFGVAPALLRQLVNLDDQELRAVPELSDALRLVADLVGRDPRQHVNRFQWKLLSSPQSACGPTMAGNAVKGVSAAPTHHNDLHPVELSFDLVFAADSTARDHAHALTEVSLGLSRVPGITLLQDPARNFTQETLSDAGQGDAAGVASWCLSLTNTRAPLPIVAGVAP